MSPETIETPTFPDLLAQLHLRLNLVMNLKMPLVVFTDNYNREFIDLIRKNIGMENQTKVFLILKLKTQTHLTNKSNLKRSLSAEILINNFLKFVKIAT